MDRFAKEGLTLNKDNLDDNTLQSNLHSAPHTQLLAMVLRTNYLRKRVAVTFSVHTADRDGAISAHGRPKVCKV